MSKNILGKTVKDTRISYDLDTENGIVGLSICPETDIVHKERNARVMPVCEVKIVGDRYGGSYFGGESMKGSDTTYSLKFDHIEEKNGQIITFLKSESGLEAIHTLTFHDNRSYFTVSTELANNTGKDVTLEMLSSFATI